MEDYSDYVFDYNDYDYKRKKACDEIKEKNNGYLELFSQALIADGLKSSTISKHLGNVAFYINHFLLYEEPLTIDYGTRLIASFLGDYFIRKCMWSTPGNIKTTAASIKKFYKCMANCGLVEKSDYENLCSEIKNGIKTWQATCTIYNQCCAMAVYHSPDESNLFALLNREKHARL